METRLPCRPTRGSLTSPSYLARNRTLGPPLENNPEPPPSSRLEGLRLLYGLETSLSTSVQTPQQCPRPSRSGARPSRRSARVPAAVRAPGGGRNHHDRHAHRRVADPPRRDLD